jgi:hypothetical protein
MKTSNLRGAAVAVLSLAVLNLGFVGSAQAAIVDTGALVATSRESNLAAVRAGLNREDVKRQLEQLGADPAGVDARVASLSDVELQRMADQMRSAPAGGDGLALVGAVFVILIILEFVGVIDIFKRSP